MDPPGQPAWLLLPKFTLPWTESSRQSIRGRKSSSSSSSASEQTDNIQGERGAAAVAVAVARGGGAAEAAADERLQREALVTYALAERVQEAELVARNARLIWLAVHVICLVALLALDTSLSQAFARGDIWLCCAYSVLFLLTMLQYYFTSGSSPGYTLELLESLEEDERSSATLAVSSRWGDVSGILVDDSESLSYGQPREQQQVQWQQQQEQRPLIAPSHNLSSVLEYSSPALAAGTGEEATSPLSFSQQKKESSGESPTTAIAVEDTETTAPNPHHEVVIVALPGDERFRSLLSSLMENGHGNNFPKGLDNEQQQQPQQQPGESYPFSPSCHRGRLAADGSRCSGGTAVGVEDERRDDDDDAGSRKQQQRRGRGSQALEEDDGGGMDKVAEELVRGSKEKTEEDLLLPEILFESEQEDHDDKNDELLTSSLFTASSAAAISATASSAVASVVSTSAPSHHGQTPLYHDELSVPLLSSVDRLASADCAALLSSSATNGGGYHLDGDGRNIHGDELSLAATTSEGGGGGGSGTGGLDRGINCCCCCFPADCWGMPQPEQVTRGSLDLSSSNRCLSSASCCSSSCGEERRDEMEWARIRRALLRSNNNRWCPYCSCSQPIRTKHCYDCGKCVLKFDHHCFWISTCVGWRNHARFWCYLVLECILSWATFLLFASDFDYEPDVQQWVEHNSSVALFCAALLIASFFLSILVAFHSYLIVTNQTTYEHTRAHRISYLRDMPPGVLPFDKGILKNVEEFFCTRDAKPPLYEVPPREELLCMIWIRPCLFPTTEVPFFVQFMPCFPLPFKASRNARLA